jgi:hypothetical protein
VKLVGAVRDAVGDSTGVLSVDDADGVRVYLYAGGLLRDSTATTDGAYAFPGLRNGSYASVARLWGSIADSTVVTVADGDVSAPKALTLASAGNLTAYPNPFTGSIAIRLGFAAPSQVVLRAEKPDRTVVRVMAQASFPQGEHMITWDGTDAFSNPVAVGPYWILFRAGDDLRGRLVVKEP